MHAEAGELLIDFFAGTGGILIDLYIPLPLHAFYIYLFIFFIN